VTGFKNNSIPSAPRPRKGGVAARRADGVGCTSKAQPYPQMLPSLDKEGSPSPRLGGGV